MVGTLQPGGIRGSPVDGLVIATAAAMAMGAGAGAIASPPHLKDLQLLSSGETHAGTTGSQKSTCPGTTVLTCPVSGPLYKS